MRIINGTVFCEDNHFHNGCIDIKEGIITDIYADTASLPEADGDIVDAQGAYVIPGLIDLHFHGALGYDICDKTKAAFEKIAAFELSQGVTTICPATMTLPEKELCAVLACGSAFAEETRESVSCAELCGFNMEGPFISPKKKGAQNEKYIKKADIQTAERFIEAAGGLLKILGLAPEESPDFESFIGALKGRVRISLAHTNADYDTAARAISAGVTHAVHLYNAMSPFSHRDPGVVNAVFDSENVNAELICDGIHLHQSAVRTAFRELSAERIVLISDSLRAAGMPDGLYELGGQQVKKTGNLCTLAESGTIAGSVSSLYDCMVNTVKKMEIPLETAVRCASLNPARILGLSHLGELSAGKQADLLLIDRELCLKRIFKRGCSV
ncbi:MAG: N-acetylglucosamine-6-phosphate deacetylase [Lachnospiraceae bacterium]|nr:N-acetylglucosamine-6-phosphate deacetylase [Lachnospiraceae bacterium]